MMKKAIKFKYAIIIYILVFILSTGATFAISDWMSGNTLLSGGTMCFDIEYSGGEAIDMSGMTASLEFTEDSSASTTLSFSRKDSCELYGKGTITANVTTNSSVNLSSEGLKYKIFKNNELEEVASGSITETGDNVIYDDFYILDMVDTYTVYFWLDANSIDNSYLEASFSGTVGSSAISTPNYPGHIDEDIPVTNQLVANFYYYDNTAEKVDFVSETCAGTGDTCTVTVPEEVTSTTGIYGNSYSGVSTTSGNMTSAGVDRVEITENTSFYALYSTEVDYKYYDTEWKDESIYRNSYINDSNQLVTVLSKSANSIESITTSTSSNLLGYSNTGDTTVSHNDIESITNSNSNSIVEVYQLTVNYTKDDNISSISKTTDSCSFTSPSTTCTVVTPSITPKENFVALGWYDSDDTKIANENANLTISTNNATYIAKASDSSEHVCLISTTSTLKSDTQTATLTCTDNIGITKYYWGTSQDGTPDTEIDSTTNMNITKTISTSGTYYLRAEDTTGNISEVVSQTYYSYNVENYLLNVTGTKNTYTTNNYTKVNSNTYIAPKDTTITLSSIYTIPTGGTYVAASVGVASTTAPSSTLATSTTLTSNTTYTMWFNRLEYTITVETTTGGTNKVTTQNNATGVTATSSSDTKTISIRYGESLTATGTASTGYTFSKFTGLSTSTTNPVTITPNASGTITSNFTANTYTIAYSLNGGTLGSNSPTSANYDQVINISNPTKSGWTFTGWTFDGDTTLAVYGTSSTSVTNSWTTSGVYVTAEYFKNLTSTSGTTVTLTAHFKKEVTGTFFYYYNGSNGGVQASSISTCMLYDADTICNFTIPSEVTSSTGPDSASYYGVSTSTSNSTTTTTYNSNYLNYYAVYRGTFNATYTKENDNVSSIGKTSDTCNVYKYSNGSSYTSTTCTITLPDINPALGYMSTGWYDSSDSNVGETGDTITLSSNVTYTAKARKLTASDFSYDNSNTGMECNDVQCAIDELDFKVPALGDYVSYTPSSTSYITDTSKTNYTSTQEINPSELNLWRVLNINDDGTIELISEYVSSTEVYFQGLIGYQNFVGYLNVLTSQYETEGITAGSRYFGYNGQTEYITDTSKFTNPAPWTLSTGRDSVESQGGGDALYTTDYNQVSNVLGTRVAYKVGTGTATSYWMASRYYSYSSETSYYWNGRYVDTSGSYNDHELYYYARDSFHEFYSKNALRPIVTLKYGLEYSGEGTEDDPLEILYSITYLNREVNNEVFKRN